MRASGRSKQGLTMRQNQAMTLLAPFLRPGARAGDTLSLLSVSPKERERQGALEQSDLQSEVTRLSTGQQLQYVSGADWAEQQWWRGVERSRRLRSGIRSGAQ
ncbi:MAG: hypothetical protein ABIQ79_01665 [Nitrospiraceae bacterium]